MIKEMWSHSGDLGDIIYALPAIRAGGGGNSSIVRYAEEDPRTDDAAAV